MWAIFDLEDVKEAKGSKEVQTMPSDLEDKLIDTWDMADKGDWGVVSAILKPENVNSQTPSSNWSPLMIACGLCQVTEKDVQGLLDIGANVELQDEDGWTCVHWAAQNGCTVALGALVNAIGCEEGGEEALARLLAKLDNKGKTAATVAREARLEASVLSAVLGFLGEG
ncbi:unnamed protein product [Choristocarpus tenellus]